MDVLSGIPEEKRPIILERGMLLSLHKRVMFKRAVIFHLDTPLILFRCESESRWIRSIIYKRLHIPMVKSPLRQITYASRYCNSSRCNENDNEVVDGLKSVWNRVSNIIFDGMSYDEQILLMANTDMFITIHGAQLTNLVFMHPQSVVIEIMNPYFRADFYEQESKRCEMRYYEFRQTRIARPIPWSIRSQWWDFNVNYHTIVNVDALLTVVKSFIRDWYCVYLTFEVI